MQVRQKINTDWRWNPKPKYWKLRKACWPCSWSAWHFGVEFHGVLSFDLNEFVYILAIRQGLMRAWSLGRYRTPSFWSSLLCLVISIHAPLASTEFIVFVFELLIHIEILYYYQIFNYFRFNWSINVKLLWEPYTDLVALIFTIFSR